MQLRIQIRRWYGLGLSAVLCISGLAVAADTATTSSTNPARPATAQPVAPKQSNKRTSSHASAKSSKGVHGKKSARKRGQQAIDSARAREIQTALIREHYLQGEPSGSWDGSTQAAMQRYQADRGWQSKTTPDARALIKLGLGPNHDHLLNPDSAMLTSAATTPASTNSRDSSKQSSSENNFSQK